MVANSGVVFPASMADVLANAAEITFGSFIATFPAPAATPPPTTSVAAPVSDLVSETHPPKPYDLVQGIERVASMLEETLQICERAERSTRSAQRPTAFPFGLRPSAAVFTEEMEEAWSGAGGRSTSDAARPPPAKAVVPRAVQIQSKQHIGDLPPAPTNDAQIQSERRT
jgi:hypothetical protein